MILTSKGMYQDNDGQWWVERANGERARCFVRICHRCGAEYVPYPMAAEQLKQRSHCTRSCYWACKREGKHDNPSRIKRGPENHKWTGGRIKRRGYVHIYMPDHHSIAGRGTTRKYVLEHRVVMEEKLGRPLLRTEQVHHINGVTDDNRPENLELWIIQQPAGQRAGEGRHCATCSCEAMT